MSKNNTITVDELKQGDILLFAPGNNWVFKIIAFLTDCDVSHAAFSYNKTQIIEETPPHAMVSSLDERRGDRQVTVMRLNPEVDDMDKIINIANQYVTKKTPYPKALIGILAVYFLIKKVIPGRTLWHLVSQLLKVVMTQLMEFIDKEFYGDTHPMDCSQFVYHCHQEAGGSYKLIPKEKEKIVSILHLVEAHLEDHASDYKDKLAGSISDISLTSEHIDIDDLLATIYHELKHPSEPSVTADAIVLEKDIVITIHEFCMVLDHFLSKTGFTTPEETAGSFVSPSVHHILIMEEYFITPGDLLNGFKNLSCVGTLK